MERSPAKLIIINGPPGSGKSTLCERLHTALPMSFSIHEDALRRLYSNYREHKKESLRATRDLVIAMTNYLLKSNTTVIVDQFIGPEDAFNAEIENLAKNHGVAVTRITLSTTEETSLKRVSQRGYEKGGLLDEKRVSELWKMVQDGLATQKNTIVIVTDTLSLDEVFEKAKGYIGF